MTRTPPPAAVLAAALLLAGCSTSPGPGGSASPTTSAPPLSTTANPSPTSTLSAAQQKAVDEATGVILAYQQMLVDLQADPQPNLNELNTVAAQPQLKIDLMNLQQSISAGETVIESSGPVKLATVEPITVDLEGDPPTVTLLVCVDATNVAATYKGKPVPGQRQSLVHRVVKTTYLAAPGWAVAKVLPPDGFDQPQPC